VPEGNQRVVEVDASSVAELKALTADAAQAMAALHDVVANYRVSKTSGSLVRGIGRPTPV